MYPVSITKIVIDMAYVLSQSRQSRAVLMEAVFVCHAINFRGLHIVLGKLNTKVVYCLMIILVILSLISLTPDFLTRLYISFSTVSIFGSWLVCLILTLPTRICRVMQPTIQTSSCQNWELLAVLF